MGTYSRMIFPLLVFFAATLLITPGALAGDAPGEERQVCLGCHAMEGMTLVMENGQELSLKVSGEAMRGSVHGSFSCSTCHTEFTIDKHPAEGARSLRAYRGEKAEICAGCHFFDPAESVHGRMLAGLETLVCTDCHGAHAVEKVTLADAGGENCMGCHQYPLVKPLPEDQALTLLVSRQVVDDSVHSPLGCTDCHFGYSSGKHPDMEFRTRRNVTMTFSDTCRRCHFDKYTRTLESIHYDLLSQGVRQAPVCVDCHGAHGIQSGKKEKLLSAKKCRKCHPNIYDTYAESVHGAALLSEHNQDVPVCSDCHRAHEIADPRTADFHNRTPEICGGCHGDEDLMARYGLSTAVLDTYLTDFHGVTARFYQKEGRGAPNQSIGVCTDCHGIHDIRSTQGEAAAELKRNLLEKCRKCHPDARGNFPDAWLSHYEPSLEHAPLVYAIMIGYKIFIPFMIIGLVLQILLHIWRYAVNR